MSFKSIIGDADPQGFIAITSDHDQRPDGNSMRTYGAQASPENPWELRLKTAARGIKLTVFITKVTHLGGTQWRLEGTSGNRKIVIEWSTRSIQGNLMYVEDAK